MKFVFCFLLGLLSANEALAGCKVEQVADHFTGESKTVTMSKKWKTTGLGDLDITEMGGKFYFHYPLFVFSGVDLPLPVESKVLFKLEDGKMVELSPTKLVTPEMKTW
ncbi:MAG: hypothetical protein HN348_35060, partial [Proteobacteria bacterium]|nr:hypothetical protein [Pseudomonadota bacterium]